MTGTQNNSKGLVLVGLVVLIVLCAIGFTVTLYVLSYAIEAARIEETRERLRAVEAASIGHQYVCHNDAGNNVGYFSSHTSFPGTTNQLSELHTSLPGHPAEQDAYGNNITLNLAGGSFIISSPGPTAEMISVARAPRDNASLAVQIVDLSPTGVDVPAMLSIPYIKDDGVPNALDEDGDGHILLDNGDLNVSLSLTRIGGGDAPDRYNTTTNCFEWDSVSMGYHLLTMQPVVDNDHCDPFWTDSSGGDSTNRLTMPIFIYPTTSQQRFNIMYPVIARSYEVHELGAKMARNRHGDETIDSDDNGYDGLDEPPGVPPPDTWTNEFQLVGRNDIFTADYERMRVVMIFDLNRFPDLNIGSSKVSYAMLQLFEHSGTRGDPDGAGSVEVWKFRRGENVWPERTWGDPHWRDWSWVNTEGTDYSDLQDFQDFNSSNPVSSFTFVVTELVQQWVSGAETNEGFLIKLEDDSGRDNYWTFKSHEANDRNVRPRLIIAYYP